MDARAVGSWDVNFDDAYGPVEVNRVASAVDRGIVVKWTGLADNLNMYFAVFAMMISFGVFPARFR